MARATDALEAAGDTEHAAEGAMTLGRAKWVQGDRASAEAYYERALRLTENLQDAPVRAALLAARASSLNVQGRREEAVETGLKALAMSERFVLPAVTSRALNAIGSSRVALGDVAGLDDLRRSIEIAREAQVYEQLSISLNNLMTAFLHLGRLPDASHVYDELISYRDRYGADTRRWAEGQRVLLSVGLGRWDDAVAAADPFLADVDAGHPHYLEASCRTG
jgi:tetratricopeptide (TPR) repeat protein